MQSKPLKYRRQIALFVGLVPIVFVLLAITHTGEFDWTTAGSTFHHDASLAERLTEAICAAAGVTIVISYFRGEQ